MDELRRAIALHSRPMRQHDPSRDVASLKGPASAPLPAPPVRAPTISTVEAKRVADPARLSRMRTFAQRHEDRMDRILNRIEGSDVRGDAVEARANKVMDQFEQHQAHVDAQIGDIEKFTADMERALGNSPGSSEGS